MPAGLLLAEARSPEPEALIPGPKADAPLSRCGAGAAASHRRVIAGDPAAARDVDRPPRSRVRSIMFENVVVRPRRKALKSVIVVGSAIAHAAAVAVLAVTAMWRVSLVATPDSGDVAIAGPKPPLGAAALPAASKLTVDRPKPVKVKTKDVVQPPTSKPDEPPTPAVGAGDPTATGTPGGEGPPGPPGLPPCPQEPCTTDGDPVVEPPKPRTDPPVVKDPPIVPPTIAKGLRERGDERILPSRTTQLAMVHDGTTQVRGTFRLCVDERGDVTSVRTLSSTGYADYDDALVEGMRGWHYRPYLVQRADEPARPMPMCTVQMFVYRITP